jgi:hypothetical protein
MSALINITISKDLLEKISKNIKGSDLNAKLLKCISKGYAVLQQPHSEGTAKQQP